MPDVVDRPMWRCPRCGREFANPNQSHACNRHELEPLFARSAPEVRSTFDRILAFVKTPGPVHHPDEVDTEVEAWLSEAYAVGQQKHLLIPLGTRAADGVGSAI